MTPPPAGVREPRYPLGPIARLTIEKTVVPTLLRAGKTRANGIAGDNGMVSFSEAMIDVIERAIAADLAALEPTS